MELSERLRTTLAKAKLSPRHLGGATRIHFVTIYKAINNDGVRQPIYEQVLTSALDKIDILLAEGKLPFTEKLARKEKTDRLKDLLNTHD